MNRSYHKISKKMSGMRHVYGMPKKSWKKMCDKINTVKIRRRNKVIHKNRFKKESCLTH